MGRQKLPPHPKGDLHLWASQIYDWLMNSQSIDQVNDPSTILLAHKIASTMARANVAGILLYDPVLQTPVYSEGGQWVPFATTPRALLTYSTAYNVNGAALAAGNNKVPLAATFNHLPGAALPSADTFSLSAGKYLLSGEVILSLTVGGAQTAVAYIALASDLTTPVGTAISVPCALPAVDVNITLPFIGELIVPAGGETYALVVRTSSANFRLGNASNLSAIPNRFASIAVAQTGT
jgi:hypothetical protein